MMQWWPQVVSLLVSLGTLVVAAHAALRKRDVRAAAGWIGLILLVPVAGVLLYWLLGINRVSRAAARLRAAGPVYAQASEFAIEASAPGAESLPAHLLGITRTVNHVTGLPLLGGNQVGLLRDGDGAYPAMLAAIAGAQKSVALAMYIFDNGPAGAQFVEALAAAVERGVQVRVLIDDAGARYSSPPVDGNLRRRGVPVARFLPVWTAWFLGFANMRNHRKVLVVDGRLAFTGGMNIRHGCLLADHPRSPTRDLELVIEGPAVAQLSRIFAEDWTFATGEILGVDVWFPRIEPMGETYARAISDGPDADLDHMRWAFLSALASARRTVRIQTPYFLPDEGLVTALNVAALRGVQVDIVLPARGNLRFVDWAVRGEVWKVLDHGCRVWLGPSPFDHSKALVVDEAWCLLGSANWDARSLRLNFELGVECYDPALARAVADVVDERIMSSQRLTRRDLDAEGFAVRLRNAVARLMAPYL